MIQTPHQHIARKASHMGNQYTKIDNLRIWCSYRIDGAVIGTMVHSLEQWSIHWNNGPVIGTMVQLLEQWSSYWNNGPVIGTLLQLLEQWFSYWINSVLGTVIGTMVYCSCIFLLTFIFIYLLMKVKYFSQSQVWRYCVDSRWSERCRYSFSSVGEVGRRYSVHDGREPGEDRPRGWARGSAGIQLQGRELR